MHPAVILFQFFKSLREMIIPIVVAFFAFRDEHFMYFIGAITLVTVLLVTFSTITWLRFTYTVTDEELRIESGIFIKKKRYISKGRIQSIDLTANVLHRLLGLAKVQIETAGSGTSAEASLTAVKVAEAEQLRNLLKVTKVATSEVGETKTVQAPFYQITNKRLFIAGTTSGSIGVLLAFIAFALSELEQFIPDNYFDHTIQWIIGLSVVLIVIITIGFLFVLWLLGIVGTMVKYGHFRIERRDEELFITRGLLEKKQITIPLKRIQAIGMKESMIRQPFGYVSLFAEVAGGSLDKGEEYSTLLFPIMKKDEVEDFLRTLLPSYSYPIEPTWRKLPIKAKKFYMLRGVIPFILIAIPIAIFIPTFLWTVIVFLILGLYLGYLRYSDGGFLIQEKRLMIRCRTFSRITVVLFHKRIQAYEKKQHIAHRKQNLANFKLSIIGKYGSGKHYQLKEVKDVQADSLADWFSYRV